MRLVILQDDQLLTRIDNYEGPVPRTGEYVYVPSHGDYGHSNEIPPTNVVQVKTVTWHLMARPGQTSGVDYYVGRSLNEEVVELVV
jgi:hypothetical protein